MPHLQHQNILWLVLGTTSYCTVEENVEITTEHEVTRGEGCVRCGTTTQWGRHWPELHPEGECRDCGAEITQGTMCGPCMLAFNEWQKAKEGIS